MAEPKLALIVVTHNSEQWLTPFFNSWHATAGAFPLPHEITIADAASSTSPEPLLNTLCPTAKILLCGHIGYGAAINRAAAATTAPWLLLCNPDLTFAPDFLKWCQNLDTNQPTCFAPTLLNPDGSRQPSVGNFPTIRSILADQFRSAPSRKYTSPQPTRMVPIDWATGACLLIPRAAFEKVAGFDEKFFLYVEEVDLQFRIRHDARALIMFLPNPTVTHHNPAASRPASPQIRQYAARGLLRYFAKHGTPAQLFAYRFLALASRRLTFREAFAPKAIILETPTGP